MTQVRDLRAAAPADADAAGFDPERLARIPAFFQSYLDRGKLAGISVLLARRGRVAHLSCQGVRDLDGGEPITPDTIFRVYSMTKPVTSAALMMLFEEGRFQLDHPASRYLPEFADLRVWRSGSNLNWTTDPCARPVTVRDLLTHTSGLTYGFMETHPVDRLYRKAGIGTVKASALTLQEMTARVAEIPLLFQPGSAWNYSIATDVCGRLVEVITGQSLDEVFRTRIFAPLGMADTGFCVPEDKLHRFAANYQKNPSDPARLQVADPASPGSAFASPPVFLSGGGGLVSTIGDYHRFCRMLLDGGSLDGVRLLSPHTVRLMASNHLPGGATLAELGQGAFTENRFEGSGFGLGFSVVTDPAASGVQGSQGMYSWGGAASTYFWIDPAEDLIAILMTQFMPSDHYPLRPQLQQLTYAALVD